MPSDQETQPGNGADHIVGPGAQIVAAAVTAFTALNGDATSDAIDSIMHDAVHAGGTVIERDLIWHQVGKHLSALGIGRQAYTMNWTRLEADFNTEQRTAKREAEVPKKGPTDEELAQAREALHPLVKPLLDRPDILDAMADAVNTLGAAGVQAASKALYLAGISALLPQPLSFDVHGPSSVGKSYLVRKVLTLFPADALYEFTTASAKVFFYEPADDVLKHKIVYAGEATAFYASTRDEDDSTTQAATLIRQLQSEGRITHKVTGKDADDNKVALTITREGPIALIVTSTQNLHSENATRNLIMHLRETTEQTRTIIGKRAAMRMDPDAAKIDLTVWHNLYFYLAYGPTACVVPYAGALGQLLDDHHLRIRRDVDAIITAIEAHALLNQARRERDRRGRWIATVDDYAAIQPIFDAILAHGREDVLSDASRRLHGHVVKRIRAEQAAKERSDARPRPRPLRKKTSDLPEGTITVTGRQLAAELGMSETSVRRYLTELYDLQLIKNLEARPKQPLHLRVLAGLPDAAAVSVLPAPDVLAATWKAEQQE